MSHDHKPKTAVKRGCRRYYTVGTVGVIDDSEPLSPKDAKAKLDELYEGLAWEDVLEAADSRPRL
jgi:hypothetical protein